MSAWPSIEEPELLDRLMMDDLEFEELIRTVVAKFPARAYEPVSLAQAIAYPWTRPSGSYRIAGTDVELLEDLSLTARQRVLARFTSDTSGRLPLLAFGSNGAPATLERKFAHFPAEEDRAVLALTGRLHDFDVGAAANPTVYGSMPATLFPSPGTAVRATVLWITAAQFSQLAWSEFSYRLGKLRTRFDLDDDGTSFDEVLAFVSRFGAFCVDERPVALAAVRADGRTAVALTQEQLLDAAAALALGDGANAEVLVRAIFESPNEIGPKIAATVRKASLPFASERWTPFTPAPGLPRQAKLRSP